MRVEMTYTPTFSGKTIPECLDYLLNDANTYQEFFGVEFRDCVYCDNYFLLQKVSFEDNCENFMNNAGECFRYLAKLKVPNAKEMEYKIDAVYEKFGDMIEKMDKEGLDWSAYIVEHVDNYRSDYAALYDDETIID